MAISLIVDEDQGLPGNPEAVLNDLKEATATPTPAPEQTSAAQDPAEPAPAPEVPDKFRGKSAEDIIQMYQNLESAHGRMANDLGTQRKLTDQLLELKRTEDLQNNAPELPEITASGLLDNPQETLDKYLEAKTAGISNAALERVQNLEAALAADRFTTRHADVNEVTASEGFNTWLSRSPLRLRDAQAAVNGDWAVADALLTEYKEYQAIAQPQAQAVTPDPLAAAQSAALEGRGNAAAGNAAKPTGKTYYRKDLIQLKLQNPDAYADPAFQAEIIRAYQEGRVK